MFHFIIGIKYFENFISIFLELDILGHLLYYWKYLFKKLYINLFKMRHIKLFFQKCFFIKFNIRLYSVFFYNKA